MKILTVPNPALRKKSKPIEKIDKKIIDLIKEMAQALKIARDPEGGALAAPQVGKFIRLFVADFDKMKREVIQKVSPKKGFVVFINPAITFRSKETILDVLPKKNRYLEGCLSIPNFYGFVNRPYKITVQYQTLTSLNNPHSVTQKKEIYEGLEASFVQHEYDHLDGILFTDLVLAQKGKLYELRKTDKGQDEFIEVNLE
jgi:peptide deformylase